MMLRVRLVVGSVLSGQVLVSCSHVYCEGFLLCCSRCSIIPFLVLGGVLFYGGCAFAVVGCGEY